MEALIAESLQKSYSYKEYRDHVAQLLADGLSTGHHQSADLTHYSSLNDVRMNRLDKTIKLPREIIDSLEGLQKNFTLIVLTESWCGDAAQSLPVINKMAESTPSLNLKILLRDDNDELMGHFLTNGGKSIPKVLITDTETHTVLADWGPRPGPAGILVNELKERFGSFNEEAINELQKWYFQDKGLSTMLEILELLQRA